MHLRPDPDLFDRSAWQAYLAELRAEPPGEFRDAMIEHAKAHIRAIWGDPENLPAGAA